MSFGCILLAMMPLAALYSLAENARFRWRRRHNRCVECGYPRQGLAGGAPCSECGAGEWYGSQRRPDQLPPG